MRSLAVLLLLTLALAGCSNPFSGVGGVEPRDLVSASDYRSWLIEVDHSAGARPDDALLEFVKGRLHSVVQKDSIEFRIDEAIGTDAGHAWGDAEAQSFANDHKGQSTSGDRVVTHLVFLTGHSDHDTGEGKVLGVSFGHSLIVIYSDSVTHACDPGVVPVFRTCNPSDIFRSVVVHEYGHALGLVNNGAPMQQAHEDTAPEHRRHSSNDRSVMYWAVEASNGLPLFGANAPPTDFDEDDRADLRALQ
ncbi:MAG TPA: hypothetical protein VM286_01090 [Candidatus Thermoplasmatota archaeon]|nr:hypothetical protein [Candidatus Thermoplasmatota archaeon]